MPRLPSSQLRRARSISPPLVLLLRTCRDLPSACRELRWIREHVLTKLIPSLPHDQDVGFSEVARANAKILQKKQESFTRSIQNAKIKDLCKQRGLGTPLQYLLKSEYFCNLEIICRPGVLIPRPETAEIVTALVRRLLRAAHSNKLPQSPRILDLCSGTGCVSFLLQDLLRRPSVGGLRPTTLGVDSSWRAISLARENRRRLKLRPPRHQVRFARGDVLRWRSARRVTAFDETIPGLGSMLAKYAAAVRARAAGSAAGDAGEQVAWDIIVANPPYIAPEDYMSSMTARSVRSFEPRHALVPSAESLGVMSREERATAMSGVSAQNSEAGFVGQSVRREDVFYASILRTALRVDAKLVLFEVGGFAQAVRVARLAAALPAPASMGEQEPGARQGVSIGASPAWAGIEIWRDGLDTLRRGAGFAKESVMCGPYEVPVVGSKEGNGRAVVCWRGEGAAWMASPG